MLTRFDPFADFFRYAPLAAAANEGSRPAYFRPAVDIRETDEAYEVVAELPGVAAENVSVDVEKNVLTLVAERSEVSEEEAKGYRHVERVRGTFRRSFTLPDTVDDEAIEASLANGVLTVRLPKREAPTGARKIAINAA